jgi:hypothetical protein
VKVQPRALAEAGEPPKPVVVFTITNRSDHAVKINHLSMEPIRKSGKSIFFAAPLPVGPGPWPVPPHDSIQLYQPVESFSGGDPEHKTRAQVTTTDDKRARSKRVRVRDLTG